MSAEPKKPVSEKKVTAKKKKDQLDPTSIQCRASDPLVSAWVTASAGTGKTKVLTDRVLRLMLNGARPEEILCLTFTRAGASVMTNRIRDELGTWASCDRAALEKKIKKLNGSKPSEEMIKRARQMCAEFLDAHGGMRIQTIHSFSQSLLRRFPIESGVPPYFDVMDNQTAAEALREAQAEVLRHLQHKPNSRLAKSVAMITPEVSEDDFVSLISEITYRRGQLLSLFEEYGGMEKTIDAVYEYLNAPRGYTSKMLHDALHSDQGLNNEAPDLESLKEAMNILSTGSASDQEKASILKDWLGSKPEERSDFYREYEAIFLTTKGDVRKRLTTKATQGAEDAMRIEADRIWRGIDKVRDMNAARGTESLMRMTDAILHHYGEKKRSLNLLDYDDLIYRSILMMQEDHSASWVLQKLPGNLKHILVDEAQDTNPDQWKLIGSIAKEFFTNPARRQSKDNTFFVVGDEKQSIFSFQRADPKEFAMRKKFFSDLVTQSGGVWRDVDMEIAFRSSPAITKAVDAVFAEDLAVDGLFHGDADEDRKVKHSPFRRGQAGLVEVHPLVKKQETAPLAPWSLPLEREDVSDTAVELADKIADQIKGWLDSGEKLESRDRPISPADIMILVRRRSAFVDHMVRALKKRDIPIAGADRISLREQIVVQDMIALGEVVLFPKDEYKLACVLKSPLIGMTDQQLENLAVGRKTDLWETLRKKGKDPKAHKIYKEASEYLEVLLKQRGSERPYEFYSNILLSKCPGGNGKSGLSALYGRLGFEAEDPLVEFMNSVEKFEKNHIPSLQGFLSWLDAGEAEVKRDVSLNPESPRVHIMTVHGAKGLEAPIVILPDTVGLPSDNLKARPKFLWPAGSRKIPLWVPRSDLESRLFVRERQKMELDLDREFRRLLYVAMTRAEDRLYVHGAERARKTSEKSWYSLIRSGLEKNLDVELEKIAPEDSTSPEEIVGKDDEDINDTILRFKVEQTAKPSRDVVKSIEKVKLVGVPAWARLLPKEETGAVNRFRPSEYKGTGGNDNYSAPSPLEGREESYFTRLGTIVHELLEFLPVMEESEREETAKAYLAKEAWNLDEKAQKQTLKHVMAVLNDPDFGRLFGKNSRPEVSITGFIEQNGEKKALSAQIDRLVVTDKQVMIVDYKNSRKVPKDVSQVQFKYIVQMAAYRMAVQQIYPDKQVRCALLYTRKAKLMPIPARELDKALKKVALTPHDREKKVSSALKPPKMP